MKTKQIHLMSHITNFIGFIVVPSIVVFSIMTAMLSQQATSVVKFSTLENTTYQQLLSAFVKEQAIQNDYALDPSTAVRKEQLATAITISHLIPSLQQGADIANDVLVGHILTEQVHYLFYIGQYFMAVDARDFTQVNTLRSKTIDPSLHQIEQELSRQITRVATNSTQALEQLVGIQRLFFVLGPCVLIISLLLVVMSMSMTRNCRRKLEEVARGEVAHLHYTAFTDPLTGLGNHFAYQERLTLMLNEVHRDDGVHRGDEALVLALLDIDEFKHFNDEQGHQSGDALLCGLATLLRKARLSEALFRLNGDDFALILPHTSLPEATVALERLREDAQQYLSGISIRIGIAHTNSDETTSELLQAQATAALEEAKRRGRNRVVAFAGMTGKVSNMSLAKTRAARRLLSEGKVSVAFQPIWNLTSGTVQAFEALIRPDPSYGLSGPQELFDTIEQIGRAHELDVICIQAILARAAELPPDAQIFLNLSPQSLVHDLLTGATLLEAVVRAGLEPSRVVLEITERSIVYLDELIEKVTFLKSLGFQIALDDAGAGNAGLEMLSRLPVDLVKIDRAVVSNALTDQAARSVFLGLTTIARESHLDVVAEGIENAEMLDFVQQAGVRYAQGYLLGRPCEKISDETTLQLLCPLLPTDSHTPSASTSDVMKGLYPVG